MNKINILFLSLSYILINCFFIKSVYSQITPLTINNDIQIKEISTQPNQYKLSPLISYSNTCDFNLYFSVLDKAGGIVKEEYILASNSSNLVIKDELNKRGYFMLNYLSLPVSSIPTSLFLNVSYIGATDSLLAKIDILCENINTKDIKINITSKPLLDQQNCLYVICEIKGLNYSLPILKILSPLSSLEPVQLSREQYMIYLGNSTSYLVGQINLEILFYDRSFLFQLDSYYKENTYNYGFSLEIYPYEIFVETDSTQAPVVLIHTNEPFNENYIRFNLNQTYITPKKILYKNDQKRYSYIASLPKISLDLNHNFKLLYSNGSLLLSTDIFFIYTGYNYLKIPDWTYSTGNLNYFTIKFTNENFFTSNNNYFKHQYITRSFVSCWPMGYLNGNTSIFEYSFTYPKLGAGDLIISEYPNGPATSSVIDYPTLSPYPSVGSRIAFYEMIFIRGTKYLIRIKVVDSTGIASISVGGELFGKEVLVEVLNGQYTFELIYDIRNDLSIVILNELDITSNFQENSFLYNDQDGTPVFLKSSNPNLNMERFSFSDFKFLNNNISSIAQDNHNVLFFNSSIGKDSPMALRIYDDVTNNNENRESDSNVYPIQWDERLEMFYCKFIIPKNIIVGDVHYSLIFSKNSEFYSGNFNQPLNIVASNFDDEGPIVTNIAKISYLDSFGWIFQIKDASGFEYGDIKVMGLIDNSIYKINITKKDVQGTVYNGQYNITLNSFIPCISQQFKIIYVRLVDSNGIESVFTKYNSTIKNIAVKNPLRMFMDNQDALVVSNICYLPIQDFTKPIVTEFNMSRDIVDVGSNDRKVLFKFGAIDNESGLLPYQNPIVYLLSSDLKLLECESKIESINDKDAFYSCEIELPFGFGYSINGSSSILVSLYGIVNRGGIFNGLASEQLKKSITVNMNFVTPILSRYDKYLSPDDLVLYGRLLKDTKSINVLLSNGESFNIEPKKVIGGSTLIFSINRVIDKPFAVKAIMNSDIQSNSIIVNPILFNYTINYPTSTPSIPSNSSKCLGNPLCGGKDHGYCDNNLGCICYSPWTGYDCLSKVIIVPQPSFNTTDPVIEIPINTDNSDDITSSAIYKSIVSLYGIRELNINNEPIKTFRFESWIFDQVDKYTSIYRTNIITYEKNVSIIATLKWYENETTINFANKNLTMLPSSIKYTIQIENYPFTVKVNTLELIMFASFESSKNKDICSLKDFSTSPDEQSDYLKIQIENKSFYGRFIKRAIIDSNKTVLLSNQLLDSSMNTINTPNQVQSFIGISIPYFESKVFIDPDFSVIINPHSVSSSSSNSKCTNNNKLSNTKIAGIVIGCVAFVAVITISIIYGVYKFKQDQHNIKNIDNKLKNFNNNQN